MIDVEVAFGAAAYNGLAELRIKGKTRLKSARLVPQCLPRQQPSGAAADWRAGTTPIAEGQYKLAETPILSFEGGHGGYRGGRRVSEIPLEPGLAPAGKQRGEHIHSPR